MTMTRTEKISLSISALALAVSILSPVVVYYWFDTNQKEYTYRAVLAVVNSDEDIGESSNEVTIYRTVVVKNIGNRPAEGLMLAMRFRGSKAPDKPFYTREAVDYEVKASDPYTLVKLNTALAAGRVFALQFHPTIANAWITTKHGEEISLWGGTFRGAGATSEGSPSGAEGVGSSSSKLKGPRSD